METGETDGRDPREGSSKSRHAAECDEEELTLEERVYGHLARDLALADVLRRGLANRGRTAREMARSNGWDEDATEILDALDVYADADRSRPWQQGRRGLAETRVGLETGLALLTVEQSLRVRERLEDAWVRLAKRPRASILDHERRLELILDRAAIEEIRQLLPEGSILREQHPVSMIRLVACDDARTAGVVALVAAGYNQRGIPVLHLAGGDTPGWLLIPSGRLAEAYDLALVMTRGSGGWPEALRSLRRSVDETQRGCGTR